MNSSISFTVVGKASPSGSKKAFRHPKTGRIIVMDTAKGKDQWQAYCRSIAMQAAQKEGWSLETGAVALTIQFVFARPKSHYGTGKNAGKLKPNLPTWHTQKPDRTKLLRCTEDAFTGVLWRDDSQVVLGQVKKIWGEVSRADVMVSVVS